MQTLWKWRALSTASSAPFWKVIVWPECKVVKVARIFVKPLLFPIFAHNLEFCSTGFFFLWLGFYVEFLIKILYEILIKCSPKKNNSHGDRSLRPLPPLERARRQGAAIVFSGAHLLFTGGLGGLSDVSLRSLEEGRRYAALDLIGAHAPRLLRKRIRSLRWANSCCCQLGLRLCEGANAPSGSRWPWPVDKGSSINCSFCASLQFDLRRFPWRRIAGCPDAFKDIEGAVVIDIDREPSE